MIDFQWADPVISGRICLTLLHSLWQVALLTVLAGIAARMVRRVSVERSYQFHLAALLVALIAIPVTYSLVEVPESQTTRITANPVIAKTNEDVPLEVSNLESEDLKSDNSKSAPLPPAAITDEVNSTTTLIPPETPSMASRTAYRPAAEAESVRSWQILAPWIAAVYVFGVAAMLLRLVISVIKANRLRRECQPVTEYRLHEILRTIATRYSMKLMPALLQAERAIVPQVIGFVRPMILLPTSAMTGLSTDELELILTHELAHIRRYDMWAAMLQRLAEAVLFFNPALWFLSRRISELREFCCDDIACRVDPFTSTVHARYAQALLKVVEMSRPDSSTHSQLASLAASGRSPSELRRRMARLLGEPLREPVRISRGGLLVCFSVVAGLLAGPSLIPRQKSETANAAPVAQDEPAKAETHRTFRLTVNGPDGKPVSNASCEIRNSTQLTAEQVLEGEFVKVGTYDTLTTTNKNGQLCLALPQRLGRLEINIKKDGFGPYWASWVSGSSFAGIPDEFTAELDYAWSVGGIIVDENGAPVADARIAPSIEFKKRPGDTSQLRSGDFVKTDSEGRWRYDHVPASLDHLSISIHHPGFQPVSKPLSREGFEIKDDLKPSSQIVLPHGLHVTGTITDDLGMPIQNALVRTKIQDERREARTDENGVYSLNGCDPSVTRIVASASGRAIELQAVRVEANMKPINFTLKPGGHIRIRVVDEQGKGLPKARIFLQRWRGRVDYFEFDHIDDYCDKNGVWEWNEAPLDEFQADISTPGRMGLPMQSLTAREEEYVFTPPQLLIAAGRVIDAKTRQPIPEFRVIPGIRNDYNKKLIWINKLGFTATDGTYRVPLDFGEDCPGYVVKIEAENYKPAVSRDFKFDEGSIQYDFELQAASDLVVTIQTADGVPAAGAVVVLGVEGSQISIHDGRIESANYATRLVADKDGLIQTAAVEGPFELIVVHDSGFAHVVPDDGKLSEPVRLTPWAQCKGTFRIGPSPGKEITLELYTDGIHSMGSKSPSISASCNAVTTADGQFEFTRVFPGRGWINRSISRDGEYGTVDATSTVPQSVEFTAGETTSLDYGGNGAAVIGALTMPASTSEAAFWGFATVYIDQVPDVPELPEKVPSRNPIAWATVNRDGSFRIDDMPAGNYRLSVRFDRNAPGMLQKHKFTVPAVADGESATTIDLGELKLIAIE